MYLWLGAFAVFGLVEAATAGLTSIWFALGALAALIATALGAQMWLQVTIFLLTSALTLAVTRPLIRRYGRRRTVPTNADRALGRTARVTEDIDNRLSAGTVYVDGKTWTARSADGSAIPKDAMVTVVAMEGVKLIVRRLPERGEAEKTEEK